jgi:hypothetical protein
VPAQAQVLGRVLAKESVLVLVLALAQDGAHQASSQHHPSQTGRL